MRRGELNSRLDHYYHLPEFEIAAARLRNARFRVVELRDIALQITDGTHFTPNYVDAGIPFVSAKDVDEFEVSFQVAKFVSEEEHKVFERRCNPKPGDVLLSKIGTIGRAAVIPQDAPVFDLFVSVCLIKPNGTLVVPEYLCAVLNTDLVRTQFSRALKGIGVPDLHLEDIRKTLIPLPTTAVQTQLSDSLLVAYSAAQVKLNEAASLLRSLDAYVLESLGINVSEADSRSAYAVRLSDIRQRFDADYNSPRFRTLRNQIEHGKFPVQTVGSLFGTIVSGFAAGSAEQTDDPNLGVPHLRPLNITDTAELTLDGTKFVPREALQPGDFLRKGELLFNNTNSTAWVGKSVVFDADRECACSNHITRLTLRDEEYDPSYFAAVFNALRSLGFFALLSTNFNNQAGINAETLKRVRIPVPLPKMQRSLALEVAHRRARARCLREEAAASWETAKQHFELELLGPEQKPEALKSVTSKGEQNS